MNAYVCMFECIIYMFFYENSMFIYYTEENVLQSIRIIL